MRLPGAENFCGRGFLTTDGDVWQRSRKLLKPTFARNNLQDLKYLSEQVDIMIAQIPQNGETVDLQPLLYGMLLNTSIKFLLGVDPTESLTDDRDFIRSQILQGMMASQETTSALLGNACFLLSRHPAYWQKIRDATSNHDLSYFDFDALLNLKIVRNIIHEALRLYPIFPIMGRNAIRDTTLPTGGGSVQGEPVFVQQGTIAAMNYLPLHRDPAVYGEDTEAFRPERWETIQPSH
ncbi:cytochrome P450 [Ampelomyces quisqualis]|uniref:Cytochrome P450 n=1 Tax=Ampelomyces quisqualis TaxID=50730 RepID=A0A6A5QSC4_AMPQU|nr:cytochrome P450 [Ampelomyces quisqualis]